MKLSRCEKLDRSRTYEVSCSSRLKMIYETTLYDSILAISVIYAVS